MPASTALIKVLRALQEEAARNPEIQVPFRDWSDYRRYQEWCNRNYTRTCELEPPYYGWRS